ncbi:hypothetical protein L1280_002868 [Deinococcus sp. HSC-46F16]|uniref:DUF2171 domain-containing protein n=1 Tax=Deinococcus sp. HSC-46F16 TaxID=2910968 RepID=UPI00209E47B9|nr:DUF2171 domain-containing protein [Deinococcus sp. HSC-46F16]MCP2015692.1 hypothetical protein [Deinococcus sp. HSC-46F16]
MTQNDTGEITRRIEQDLRERLEAQGEHLQVKDVNGEHVGTVDHVEGDQLKLTRTDSPDGQHHYVPLSQVESMDDVAVYLNVERNAVQ